MNPIIVTEPIRFFDDNYVAPPGTLYNRLEHPYYGQTESITVATFFEHRYAFFFWVKWYKELLKKEKENVAPPHLITLDWRQDLAWPTKEQREWLDGLDMNSNTGVSVFAWSSLSDFNDEQIMAAAYLNLIGDVYVHCRQSINKAIETKKFTDRFGNVHTIRVFNTFERMETYLLKQQISNVYFDIDLDYFVLNNPYSIGGKKRRVTKFSYLPDVTIKNLLNRERPLINWIFQRLRGLTIAIEPEHTGGLMRSLKYLGMIDKLYFKPSLLTNCGSNWEGRCRWKHLR